MGAIQCRKVSTHAGYIKRESSGLSWPHRVVTGHVELIILARSVLWHPSVVSSTSNGQHSHTGTQTHTQSDRAILQLGTKTKSATCVIFLMM